MPDDDPSDTPESPAARQAAEAHRARCPVEAAYTPPGPYATTTSTVTDGAGKAIYDLYSPQDYAALGFKSPVVTWGNGTGGIPPSTPRCWAAGLPTGLASSARPRGKLPVVEMGDAAHYLVTRAGTAGSVFYGNST